MDLISKLFIFPVLLLALLTIYLIAPLIGIKAPQHRYSSIDGFRGFLAMFVFLHHSAIWYYFSHIYEWSHIPSNIYNQFGSTSVAFFFMITAFLFFSKLINSFPGDIDWAKLYISRVMRIMPMYIVAVFILLIIVGILSHFQLRESFSNLSQHILQWIFFMEPNINNIHGTRFINSGVQWSLAYEWFFYCSLAVIGWIFFRFRTSPFTLILTMLFLASFLIIIEEYYPSREWKRMFSFLPGIIAAFLSRNEKVRMFCSDQSYTLLLIVVPGIILSYYPTVFGPIQYLCASVVFVSIACGNNLFGILTLKPSLLLGQISYSIYLLHGFLLFITFHFVIGVDKAVKLPVLPYWILISVCAIVAVVVCSISYYFVEKPGIENIDKTATKLKSLFKKEKSIHPIKSNAIV